MASDDTVGCLRRAAAPAGARFFQYLRRNARSSEEEIPGQCVRPCAAPIHPVVRSTASTGDAIGLRGLVREESGRETLSGALRGSGAILRLAVPAHRKTLPPVHHRASPQLCLHHLAIDPEQAAFRRPSPTNSRRAESPHGPGAGADLWIEFGKNAGGIQRRFFCPYRAAITTAAEPGCADPLGISVEYLPREGHRRIFHGSRRTQAPRYRISSANRGAGRAGCASRILEAPRVGA